MQIYIFVSLKYYSTLLCLYMFEKWICLGPREAKENGGEREQEREEENGPKNEAT